MVWYSISVYLWTYIQSLFNSGPYILGVYRSTGGAVTQGLSSNSTKLNRQWKTGFISSKRKSDKIVQIRKDISITFIEDIPEKKWSLASNMCISCAIAMVRWLTDKIFEGQTDSCI